MMLTVVGGDMIASMNWCYLQMLLIFCWRSKKEFVTQLVERKGGARGRKHR